MKRCTVVSLITGVAAGFLTVFGILGVDSATIGWVQLDNLRLPDSSTDVLIHRDISHLYIVNSNYVVLTTSQEAFADWIDRTSLTTVSDELRFESGVPTSTPNEVMNTTWIPSDAILSVDHFAGNYRNHRVAALYHEGRAYIVAHPIRD